MRVLHIMSGFGGGISMFIQNQAQGMVGQGISFDVATYDEVSQEFQAAIRRVDGQIYTMYNPKKSGWKKFIREFEKVLATGYDVVHCHIGGYRAIPYYLLAKKAGIRRFYLHGHLAPPAPKGFKQQMFRQFEQFCNRRMSDCRLGCGTQAVDYMYGSAESRKPVYMIPNSIDVHRFILSQSKQAEERQRLRQHYGIDPDQLVIGQIGRLAKVKNHKKTLDIAETFKHADLPILFLIIGAGELEDTLKEKSRQRGLSQSVRFLGRVEPISGIYPLFDGLLLTSYYEGFPTVAVESQAMGIPMVMADTITPEVDLGLNLVRRIPLEISNRIWQEALLDVRNLSVSDPEPRMERFQTLGFSIEGASELYRDLLLGKRKHFKIGDRR